MQNQKGRILMKKIISLILALSLMCCVLSACGGQTPQQLVSAAMEKTTALDAMDAVMEMSVSMEMNDLSMTVPMTYEIQATDMQSDNPKMLIGLTMKLDIAGFATDVDMDIYSADGWAYIASNGSGYKVKATAMEGQLGADASTDMIMQMLPEELLKDAESQKNDDGSQTVTVNIDGETFSKLYEELINSLNSTTGTSVTSLTISDAVVKITVKDGYVSVYDMDFTMNMDVAGTAVKADASASVTYKNPGKDVTITPPAGYEDFPEMG